MRNKLFIATFSEDALNVAKDFGVGLEINHTCISEDLDSSNRRNLLEQIREDIAAAGVSEPSGLFLHGPFTEIHPAAIDYRARQLGMERLNEAYEAAAALGINRMVVHTGWLPFIYFKGWQAEKGAEFWQKFMSDKPSDFRIYVENVLEDEPYMMLDMMRQIDHPAIKLCLDIGHANATTPPELPVEKWIEVLGTHIGHFHLHNNDGTGDSHSAFDRGSMDMNSIFSAIDDFCEDDVTLTIEARDARACLEWLHSRKYIYFSKGL